MAKPPRDVEPNDLTGLKARAAAAPGNFVSQLAYGQALYKAGDFEGAVAPLQRASDLVPMATGGASPHALLAQIYVKRGDEARARKELRALLAFDHANVTAARQLAELAGAAKASEDEDYSLRLIADLDPFESSAHTAPGQAAVGQGRQRRGAHRISSRHGDQSRECGRRPRGSGRGVPQARASRGSQASGARGAQARAHVRPGAGPAARGPGTELSAMRILTVVFIAAATLISAPAVARAQQPAARYALVVEGVSGSDEFAVLHRKWLDSLVTLLKDKFAFDPTHVLVLAETPKAGEDKATADGVRTALGRLAKETKPEDLVFVMLIGHGGGADGSEAKFNLVGPDLGVSEWNALLKPVAGHLAFVDATSASFPFLTGLAAPGRVIITATNSVGQKFHTVFADAFIQALTASAADQDKNGRISLLEAFVYASGLVKQSYEQRGGLLPTEHAVFDDTGQGSAHDAAVAGGAVGTVAGLTYLDAVAVPTSSNPEVQQLLLRQRALTEQVDDLRRRQPSMTPEAYDQEFEKLIIELSLVSRDVRKRTGG